MAEKPSTKIAEVNGVEEDLIRKSATNPESFRPLYEAYFKKIFLFILHRVGEKEIAGDLSQQVFLNALSNIGRFEFRGLPFSAWLYRIAINHWKNCLGKICMLSSLGSLKAGLSKKWRIFWA